jgi:hypothetical protein
LQSTSHAFCFAAGDCASIQKLAQGTPPKAGVYAVRAGPILIQNLMRYLESLPTNNNGNTNTSDPPTTIPLVNYEPQGDFLKLLVCGDGKALGFRFGLALYGTWVMDLKDRIDQNFMDLFAVDQLPPPQNQPLDTSQYDSKDDDAIDGASLPSTADAAVLLQRTDDHVDYRDAWRVLKAMAHNLSYQKGVLDCIEAATSATAM